MKTINTKYLVILLLVPFMNNNCKSLKHSNTNSNIQMSNEQINTMNLIFSHSNYYIKNAIKFGQKIAIDSILVFRHEVSCHENRKVSISNIKTICPNIDEYQNSPEMEYLFNQKFETDSTLVKIPDSLKHIFKYYEGLSDLMDPNTSCYFFSPFLNTDKIDIKMLQLFFYSPLPPSDRLKNRNNKIYGLKYLFYKNSLFEESIQCTGYFDDFDSFKENRYRE